MQEKVAIVVTSISRPNQVLAAIAQGAAEQGYDFFVVGDTKSPAGFSLAGCQYFAVAEQVQSGLAFAAVCPTGHYARKNIGYLLAMRQGATVIVETDDDNIPRPGFFAPRQRCRTVQSLTAGEWVNVYRYFSEALIWPRGLPLTAVNKPLPALASLPAINLDCPIQQGLADENPDVDAIYRLLLPLPQSFSTARAVALGPASWCPFNSQNTTWWRDAFPLLYLPACCSFRMTDIWRSFVAQRIAWENDWQILFHEATVWQERNAHDLMQDFAAEVPGYMHNDLIAKTLAGLSIKRGREHILDNMRICYAALAAIKVIEPQELGLLAAWLADLNTMGWSQ